MKEAANENETFQPLGLATARLLESCEQKQKDAQWDAEHDGKTDQKSEEQRAQIEQRLRDVATFEKRFRPGYRSRRKR